MSSIVTIAVTDQPDSIKATDDTLVTKTWFKTKPLDRRFCYRAAQLQLYTDSFGQSPVPNKQDGSWNWFELIILEDDKATKPILKDGFELRWRSHANRLGVTTISRHFGTVFDRRDDILDNLEPGNVIGVRLCAQHRGWENHGKKAELLAKVLNEDLFSPQSWTLQSNLTPEIPKEIDTGVYTLQADSACTVESSGPELVSKIWFTSPVLDKMVIDQIEEVRLFTLSHDQGATPQKEDVSWSWFDLVILDSPEATTPRIKNGVSLIWASHTNKIGNQDYSGREGKSFDRTHDMLKLLEVGNVIGVRCCAQFAGWANVAKSAHLTVSISNKGVQGKAVMPTGATLLKAASINLQKKLGQFYDSVIDKKAVVPSALVTNLLAQEVRADVVMGPKISQPVRLLSFDGGGVRGISSLHILRQIMLKLTNDVNAKPCEYFDMIAGTSTGGLIAIMLGRLKMTVPECITAYQKLASDVFSHKNIFGSQFDAARLVTAIKTVVKQKLGDENAVMLDEKNPCKVFVVSCRDESVNNTQALHVRTYKNQLIPSSYSFTDWAIWEAARATSAAPTYFDYLQKDGYKYVDGGIRFNNPVMELLIEASSVYPKSQYACLLSIGTGLSANVSMPEGGELLHALEFSNALEAIATACETANIQANSLFMNTFSEVGGEKYCRFNFGVRTADTKPGIANFEAEIDMADYKRMDELAAKTDQWLMGKEVQDQIAMCVERLKLGQGKIISKDIPQHSGKA